LEVWKEETKEGMTDGRKGGRKKGRKEGRKEERNHRLHICVGVIDDFIVKGRKLVSTSASKDDFSKK
jgi:hypothetical protein